LNRRVKRRRTEEMNLRPWDLSRRNSRNRRKTKNSRNTVGHVIVFLETQQGWNYYSW